MSMVSPPAVYETGRNHKPSQLTVTTEPARTEPDSVPVHTLCAICSAFADSCKELDVLQFAKYDIKIENFPGLADVQYSLGTIQQLLSGYRKCHLCTLILSSWKFLDGVVLEELDPSAEVIMNLQMKESWNRVTVTYSSAAEDFGGRFRIPCSENLDISEAYLLRLRTSPRHSCDNVPILKHWLNTCLRDHGGCRSFQTKSTLGRREFPTRILDVMGDRTKLVCDTKSLQESEYVSLSHMWGNPNNGHQICLKESLVSQFRKDIAEDTLSKIYREAIRWTRLLGYRYIWIDSLCIIQDSKTDWNHEASRMALVYGNAVLNMSYLFPPDDEHIREREDPRYWMPCILRVGKPGRTVWIAHSNPPASWLKQDAWPLLKRGWVYQERMLCTRNIYLGHSNLVWECNATHLDELLSNAKHTELSSNDKRDRYYTKGDLLFCLQNLPPPRLNLIVDEKDEDCEWFSLSAWVTMWTAIVNDYRLKALSFEKDRIIAFAGFARMVSNLSGLSYVAGSWLETLQPFLLWSFSPHSAYDKTPQRDLSSKILVDDGSAISSAPSWSWFSAPVYDEARKLKWHADSFLFEDDTARFKCKHCYWARVLRAEHNGEDLRDAQDSLFYDFDGLRIVLDCVVLPAKLTMNKELKVGLRIESLMGTEGLQLQYDHDDPDVNTVDNLPDGAIVAMIAEFRKFSKETEDQSPPVQHILMGLALVPSADQNTWKRIGLWVLEMNPADPSSYYNGPLYETLAAWSQKQIHIV
ncbi:HET-domain-containing protein [Lophiostoma macrostomum CBS 122681]|uniref:HET-domain-containing protein n=1 Tax=Lophiostoma macrostomum CBS 122681 TaxID=1314788 RepID=A0A6A6THY8_9PLEO|nr:HET-domain-containing protein [Lophiostoma macrostomum CBS 122681]